MHPDSPDYRPEMIPVGNVIRFLTTKPDPVPLAAPADGLTLNTLAPRLWWHTPPGIDSVRVLVATDVTFSNVVVDRSVQEHYLDTPELDLRMTYYWRVIYRQAPWSDTWSFSIPEYVGIENDEGELPTVLSITSVFPNPIESSFTVSVGMPAAGTVGIDLYDALGRRVQRVLEKTVLAGWQNISLARPRSLAPGVYFLKVSAGGQTASRAAVMR